jgi:hypothetical protein
MSTDDKPPLAVDVYKELADERILSACERYVSARLVHDFSVELTTRREPKLHLDPEAWGTGFLAVREREGFPAELIRDLHEVTPQAILRDLYRPVRVSQWFEREVRVELDEGGRRALAEARAAAVKREPLPRIEPTVRDVVAEQARRRAFLAERWQPAMADDAPRNPRPADPDPDG